MVWATISSWSCFCWLYRASPSLAAKNIINLISILTIWWCACVESSLVLLGPPSVRSLLFLSFIVPILAWDVPFSSVQLSNWVVLCPTLWDPMNCSMPGPSPTPKVHPNPCPCLLDGDAIQRSHPLLSPSPPAPNLSQHQGLFQGVSSSHQAAKVLEFQHQCLQWTPRTDLL